MKIAMNIETNKLTQKRVLIVEDNEEIRYILDFMAQREGMQSILAKDGAEAERLIKGQPVVDVILLDVMLPYKNGVELISIIKNEDGWKDVPIIMLSSNGRENDIVAALNAGADDYITKPFQPIELLTRLKKYLR